MSDELEVTAVSVSEPRPGRSPHPETGEPPSWLTVGITIANRSDETQQVLSELRGLDYDTATRTLELLLSEPSPETLEGFHAHVVTPPFIEVPAGQEATIQVRVPAVISQIAAGQEVRELPAYELERVHCVVAYGPEPPTGIHGPSPSGGLVEWGKTAEATLVPERPGPDGTPERN